MSRFRTGAYIILALFVLLVIFWLGQFNRYHVLYYREQMQLFRFNWFYFHSYWIKPGGIAGYISAFLTQFYFYPWIGATIVSCLLAGVYLLLDSICSRNGKTGYFFVVLFIPVFLLLMAFVNQHFMLSYLVGLMIGLVGFRIYITFKKPVRYISGFVLCLVVYIIAAGNTMLFVFLVLLYDLFLEKQKGTSKNPTRHAELVSASPLYQGIADHVRNDDCAKSVDFRSPQKSLNHYVYLITLVIWTVVIPFLAYYFVYTINPREAFFALTPADFPFPNVVNVSAWLSIPFLYVCWIWAAGKIQRWKTVVWKMIVSCLLVAGMCAGSISLVSNRKAETLTNMAFSIQNNNWERTIQLGTSYPFSNEMTSYFSNIALAELGQLPYRLFHNNQTGPTGLFLEWDKSYFTILYIGEVYYRLGLIQEAEHSAFETMVGNAIEHNSLSLRRLVTTSIIMRDTALFNKYIRLFEQTLFYRQWAGRQRDYMAAALADSAYTLPGAPNKALCENFFLRYARPDFILNKLLENNPNHRLAFEYLMAWHLLDKDVESFKKGMDLYFNRFPYPDIPVHFEEALMVYQQVNPSLNILEQYPVSNQTRERFNNYIKSYQAVKTQQQLAGLHRQYGKTYWFYLHFIHSKSNQIADENETNRY